MLNKLSTLTRITLFFILIATQCLLTHQLLKLNLLPTNYLWLLIGALALVALSFALLLFLPKSKSAKQKNRPSVRRILASLLIIPVSLACGMGTHALGKLNATMNAVTENTIISDIIGVYVLKENSAQDLSDTTDYRFAVTESYDWENTQKALTGIAKKLDCEPKTVSYDHVFAIIDALYSSKADAMVLNTAYLSILEEIDLYHDFEERTRLIYEFSIEETIVAEPESTPEPEVSVTPSVSPEANDPSAENPIAPEPTQSPENAKMQPFVLYLSGSDTRSAVLKTSRSDVNILAIVNPNTKQILLVNTPRDYYIPNPAGGGRLDKLTHCGIYGIDCSMEALSDLYDVNVDYYAQVNFTGFEKLVDAIGGVTIYSEKSFKSSHGGFYIKEGNNSFNGYQAVCYARERYAFADGDHARGRNQMKLIKAILEKMTSSTVLITKYADILESMEGTFKTNIPTSKISEFVKMQLNDMSAWEITNYAVTGYGDSNTTYSMPNHKTYVMNPNRDTVKHAMGLIDKTLAGKN